jgi:3-dehydroquinate synthase
MVKIALIADAVLLGQLEELGPLIVQGKLEGLLGPLERCIELKAEVVERDERESGWRAVLNLGHTVAHGIESAIGAEQISHGFAVGIGLVMETRWAIRQGFCEVADLDRRIAGVLGGCGLPTVCPEMSKVLAVSAMRLDKKAKGATVRLPVLQRVGCTTFVDILKDQLQTLLESD